MFILSSASPIWHKVFPNLAETLQLVTRYSAVSILVALWVFEAEDLEDGSNGGVVDGGEDTLAIVRLVEVFEECIPHDWIGDFDHVIETWC
jgi:hypothetical protein